MNTKTKNTRQLRSYRPGFLLSPLGWLVGRLSNSLAHEPDLLPLLFELEPHAMHMLGIAIALGCDESVPATFSGKHQGPSSSKRLAIGPKESNDWCRFFPQWPCRPRNIAQFRYSCAIQR